MARVYITQDYYRPYSVVNALWAAAEQHDFAPDRVYLLSSRAEEPVAKAVADALGLVQGALGKPGDVQVASFPDNDLWAARKAVQAIVDAHANDEIAIDVTPGRTLAKLALFFTATRNEAVQHVFYLDVPGFDYRDEPHPLVPRRLEKCRSVLEEGSA